MKKRVTNRNSTFSLLLSRVFAYICKNLKQTRLAISKASNTLCQNYLLAHPQTSKDTIYFEGHFTNNHLFNKIIRTVD